MQVDERKEGASVEKAAGLKASRWMRPTVDACMTVVYLLQMAPGKMGNPLHEVLGIMFVVLFVAHHLLNRGWLRRLGSRRTSYARIVLASDVLLMACMAATGATGVLMSRFAAPMLSVPPLAHVVRPLHGTAAYAGLMIMALHVGLHVRAIGGYLGRRGAPAQSGVVPGALLAASLVVGCWAFVCLGVAAKLMGQPSFPDGMTPLVVQLACHLALAAPFVVAGSLIGRTSTRHQSND